ncbi:hypothetical protein J5U22_01658 [Saccharolobus shibatae]|uniref:Uncharacterized protein n=1 Tax=Saccharolobus shibatae TaxID=2286 RepID=A0A8F5C144_9CREN|nr:hypothetical protein J5U22_01658 [Saccharolobus shibatae]
MLIHISLFNLLRLILEGIESCKFTLFSQLETALRLILEGIESKLFSPPLLFWVGFD